MGTPKNKRMTGARKRKIRKIAWLKSKEGKRHMAEKKARRKRNQEERNV